MVQYYEMYWMVLLVNPSCTIRTHDTDGKMCSRSVKPSLPSVNDMVRSKTGLLIILSNGTDGKMCSQSVKPSLPSVNDMVRSKTGLLIILSNGTDGKM